MESSVLSISRALIVFGFCLSSIVVERAWRASQDPNSSLVYSIPISSFPISSAFHKNRSGHEKLEALKH
jgi:hypothetical protein